MSTYRIAEVAERAGVPPGTLRYYEQVGVLPAPHRGANGYRVYDEAVFDRLAFVSRAKQLGCTLAEIADLSVAWAGGECGPVQDRLRPLVAGKLDAARAEIADLAVLARELEDAATALERHRPVGPCDDRCGCTGRPGRDADDVAGADGLADVDGPADAAVACTLTADGVVERLDEWRRVLATGSTVVAIAGGVRVELGPAAATDVGALVRLVVAEQRCCSFFSFRVTVDQRGVGLEITAPADALDLVHALVGVAPGQI